MISGCPVQLKLFSPSQLQAEVWHLEELKLLNIRNVTDAIRSEIAVFWEKCFFSKDQQHAFAPYFSGWFSLFYLFCVFNASLISMRSSRVWENSKTVTLLEDFTEELLSLHDAEIQRLKQHYEDHKELFDGVHQWEESWRLFLELEVSPELKIVLISSVFPRLTGG